jgi:hypothetical protein
MIALVPLAGADRDAFVREEIENYADLYQITVAAGRCSRR